MADIDAGDVLEIAVLGRFNTTDDVINIYHCVITEPKGESKAEALSWVGEWFTDIAATIEDQVSNDYLVVELKVSNATQDTFIGIITVGVSGSNAGETLPPHVTALVMARTDVSGICGRKYLPPFGEDTQDNGTWGGTTNTALDDFADVWATEKTAVNLVVGKAVVATFVAGVFSSSHPIEATKVIRDTRSQRRRQLGRGS